MKPASLGFLFAFAALVSTTAPAQTVKRLKDVNTSLNRPARPLLNSIYSSNWISKPSPDGRVLFQGSNDAAGFELWMTDGTDDGTVLVADIVPGTLNSNPRDFVWADTGWFFVCDYYIGATELCFSDGTNAGTKLVKDINPTYLGSSYPSYLTWLPPYLYFSANDGTNGTELWRTDGTSAGTVRLTQKTTYQAPGTTIPSQSTDPRYLIAFNGNIYYQAEAATPGSLAPLGAAAGIELYRWNTTSNAQELVLDLWAGGNTSDSNPGPFTEWNGRLWFAADAAGMIGRELWSSDGTPAGTLLYKDINPGAKDSNPQNMVATPNGVFFSATQVTGTSNIVLNYELHWVNVFGEFLIADLNGVGNNTSSYPSYLTAIGNRVFFDATVAGAHELWTSDGAATTKVATFANPTPHNLLVAGTRLFFTATGSAGTELYSYDTVGQVFGLVKDLVPGSPSGAFDMAFGYLPDAGVLFAAQDVNNGTPELWLTSPQATGTALVKKTGPTSSFPQGFIRVGNSMYFSAEDGTSGRELWLSNGTTATTTRVADIAAGPASGLGLLGAGEALGGVLNNVLYFGGDDSTNPGRNLWRTDGTTAGTFKLKELDAAGGGYPQGFVATPNRIFFTAQTAADGRELWVTDGTAPGTQMLPVAAGSGSGGAQFITPFKNGILYMARRDQGGNDFDLEPYFSDGTAVGTVALGETTPGVFPGTPPSWFVNFTDRAFFVANNPTSGREIYMTDGTPQNTAVWKELAPGTGSYDPRLVGKVGQWFVFAYNTGSGFKLYASDGNATHALIQLATVEPVLSAPDEVVFYNGSLYFLGKQGALGVSIWRTDGSPGGTVAVTAPFGGAAVTDFKYLSPTPRGVFFWARTGPNQGFEPFATDGTPEGSVKLAEIVPSPASALPKTPTRFAALGETIFFAAQDTLEDVEPYTAEIDKSAPEVTYELAGTMGNNGWFTSDVEVLWTVNDPESPIVATTNCASTSVTNDGTQMVCCTAKSLGGTTTACAPVKRDAVKPSIGCPSGITREATSPQGAVVTFSGIVGSDAQDPNVTVTSNPQSGSLFSLGTTKVIARAVDAAGNVSTCDFNVEVDDTNPPTLTCPHDVDQRATSPSGATVDFKAVATDIVETNPSILYTPAPGAVFPVGSTTVDVEARDGFGNSTTCSFMVNVTMGGAGGSGGGGGKTMTKGCGCGATDPISLAAFALAALQVARRRQKNRVRSMPE